MPKKYRVKLTESERSFLKELIHCRSAKSVAVKRAYALLATDELGDKFWSDQQIKDAYGVSLRSIERLRERLCKDGLEIALKGKPHAVHRNKLLTGDVEARLIALRCSDPPLGHSRWTLHLLADKMVELHYVEQISHESVRQILKKTNLSPGL
jgi:transposase